MTTDTTDQAADEESEPPEAVAGHLDELEMHADALRTDLTDNHPDGGPNYAYALGDLHAIEETVGHLLDEVSVTIRILPDHQDPNAASDGREIRVPKDVETVGDLTGILNLKTGRQLMRVLGRSDPDAIESLGSADDPVVIDDGDAFTIVEKPQEAPA